MELIGSAAEVDVKSPPCHHCGKPQDQSPHVWVQKLYGGFWECPDEPDWD